MSSDVAKLRWDCVRVAKATGFEITSLLLMFEFHPSRTRSICLLECTPQGRMEVRKEGTLFFFCDTWIQQQTRKYKRAHSHFCSCHMRGFTPQKQKLEKSKKVSASQFRQSPFFFFALLRSYPFLLSFLFPVSSLFYSWSRLSRLRYPVINPLSPLTYILVLASCSVSRSDRGLLCYLSRVSAASGLAEKTSPQGRNHTKTEDYFRDPFSWTLRLSIWIWGENINFEISLTCIHSMAFFNG